MKPGALTLQSSIYGIRLHVQKYSSSTDHSSTRPPCSENVNVSLKLHSCDIKAPPDESTLRASIDHFNDKDLTRLKTIEATVLRFVCDFY